MVITLFHKGTVFQVQYCIAKVRIIDLYTLHNNSGMRAVTAAGASNWDISPDNDSYTHNTSQCYHSISNTHYTSQCYRAISYTHNPSQCLLQCYFVHTLHLTMFVTVLFRTHTTPHNVTVLFLTHTTAQMLVIVSMSRLLQARSDHLLVFPVNITSFVSFPCQDEIIC